MGELYEPYPKLPKNIRQIGERDQVLKLYVEDYVNTYLKRLKPAGGADLRVGLLLGNAEMHEDMPYVFVDGALEMEGVAQEGEKVAFTEEAWKRAYQEVEQMFPKRTVQGWFLCAGAGSSLSPLNYWKQHGQYFSGKHQLMYLNSGLEGEEAVYMTSPDGFYKLRGYSVFYERNQMMQDYMILRRDAHRVESGVDDKVIRDFRSRMDERRSEARHYRGTVGALSGICGVLAVTVLAGGVAMFGNYQKMRQMESVIASVLPEDGVLDPSGKGWTDADSPDYIIEEVPGNLPAGTSQAEEGAESVMAPAAGAREQAELVPETMSETAPQKEAAALAGTKAAQTGTEAPGGTGTAGEREETAGRAPSGESAAPKSSEAESAAAQVKADAPAKDQPVKEAVQKAGAAAGQSGDYQVYTVAKGETLFGICFSHYGNLDCLEEIMRVNALENENSIYAGQKLLIP